MTSTITLSCPDAIILASDRRCTIPYNDVNYEDNVDKVFRISKLPIGVSFWGTSSFGSMDISEHLKKFEKDFVDNTDNVDSIAQKLLNYFESIQPYIDKKMGLHIAGYCKDGEEPYPQLRHVFHESWHQPGKFTNENSNQEYHLPTNGQRILYTHGYDPYIALYNGDRAIANAYFSFLPTIYPTKRIILDKLNTDQCIGLAKLVITTTDKILDYMHTIDQTERIHGVKGLMIAKITTQKGFEWIENNYYLKFIKGLKAARKIRI